MSNFTYVREWTNTDHRYVLITTSGTTYTLESATERPGAAITIKLTVTGTATVAPVSGQHIDGASSFALSAQYAFVSVVSDGHNWNIVANGTA
jgi:hypothetical protein